MPALEIKDAHTILTPDDFTLPIECMAYVGNPDLFTKRFRNFHLFVKDIRNSRLHCLLTGCMLYTGSPETESACQQAVRQNTPQGSCGWYTARSESSLRQPCVPPASYLKTRAGTAHEWYIKQTQERPCRVTAMRWDSLLSTHEKTNRFQSK
jgi:hypothetical protein